MVEVRFATLDDVPAVVALGQRLHAESPRYNGMRFDAEKVRALAENVVTSNTGGALVAVRGETIIGLFFGYVAESWFGPDLVAGDFTFYVAPEHRGGRAALLLVQAFERWAESKGVLDCTPGVSTMIYPDRTIRFFERLGYTATGMSFTKRLR